MSKIVIEGKLINLDTFHFARFESDTELLVSFGADFLRFKGSPEKMRDIFNRLQTETNEEFPCNCKR